MKALSKSFNDYLAQNNDILIKMQQSEYVSPILQATELIKKAALENLPILICGNGGSAADAMHIAGELTGRFLLERRPIRAISLASDSAIITAMANDYDFGKIFQRQVEAHAEKEGILWAITTSGKSVNVISAAETAARLGMKVVAMTGAQTSPLSALSNAHIKIPSTSTPLIQQTHQLIYHFICAEVETAVSEADAIRR
jgi:D-sedoheptulose 7-phosphate isomerase